MRDGVRKEGFGMTYRRPDPPWDLGIQGLPVLPKAFETTHLCPPARGPRPGGDLLTSSQPSPPWPVPLQAFTHTHS